MSPTPDSPAPLASADPLVARSNLYREFQAEREEILRHKWLISEERGHDVGFETALVDWGVHHRSKWLRHRRERRPDAAHARQEVSA